LDHSAADPEENTRQASGTFYGNTSEKVMVRQPANLTRHMQPHAYCGLDSS
jgi:hypothetical protein